MRTPLFVRRYSVGRDLETMKSCKSKSWAIRSLYRLYYISTTYTVQIDGYSAVTGSRFMRYTRELGHLERQTTRARTYGDSIRELETSVGFYNMKSAL
ncbi:hypothetical protein PROFUN_01692 [Planoprotostelium fungivorum]|uniref:Uncharacterized protein n=1 Tax=Planoprotostelium fungivorum TaxID=1890364 RepID=A0A2P6MWE9_9EUKA|nr:hypothetical protein PROFUN_01692 [Planoprotostelium fungivorum]